MLSQILLEDAALCHVLFPGAWMTGAVGHTVRHSCVQRLHVHAHRVQIHDAGLAHPRVHACEGTSGTAMRCRVRALGAWHSVVRERRACMHDVRRDRAVELAAKAVVDSAPCTPAVRRSPIGSRRLASGALFGAPQQQLMLEHALQPSSRHRFGAGPGGPMPLGLGQHVSRRAPSTWISAPS